MPERPLTLSTLRDLPSARVCEVPKLARPGSFLRLESRWLGELRPACGGRAGLLGKPGRLVIEPDRG